VSERVGGGIGQLFGGCGLAAALYGLEALANKPVSWATAQFVSAAYPPERVDIDVELVSEGRSLAQGRARATTGDREVFTTMASLGTKSFPDEHRWLTMPDVPDPLDCPRRDTLMGDHSQLAERIEQRIVEGEWGGEVYSPAGIVRAWLGIPNGVAGSTVGLSIIADFFPLGIRAALGRPVFGSSLDNTIRFIGREECDWVLADFAVHDISDGICHGSGALWSPSGELLALASQTAALREL